MRKIFVIIFIFMFIRADGIYASAENDELIEIATIVEQNKLDIESWEVTIREKMPIQKLETHMKELQKKYDVTYEKEENLTTYIFHNTHKQENISVIYKGVIPTSASGHGELISVISGDKWSENILLGYKETINFNFHQYFSHSAYKFTCLLARNSDIIDRMTLQSKLINSFGINDQVSQKDEIQQNVTVEEIYGLTNLWNEKIMIVDQPINIHMAFIDKALGEEKIIIGTPILINEY